MLKNKFSLARQILVVLVVVIMSSALQAGEQKMKVLEIHKEMAIQAVHNMAVGISNYFITVQDSTKRVEFLRNFLNPIRFYDDDSGYFYVYDFNCNNISHAVQKNLQGKNLYDYQDPKGKYVIRELAEIAKNGGGFLEYYWNDPRTSTQQPKIGYVEPIKGTNYFIGDGVYLEE